MYPLGPDCSQSDGNTPYERIHQAAAGEILYFDSSLARSAKKADGDKAALYCRLGAIIDSNLVVCDFCNFCAKPQMVPTFCILIFF